MLVLVVALLVVIGLLAMDIRIRMANNSNSQAQDSGSRGSIKAGEIVFPYQKPSANAPRPKPSPGNQGQ